MFKDFDPIKKKIFRVIDNDGKVIHKKYFPKLTNEEVVKAYKDMLFERTADLMTVGFQRQGRIYTYPPNIGQEGIHIATGMAMREDDWLAPAFRELGVWLAKGATLQDVFMYFMGYEDGSKMPGAQNILPMSVPIASQLVHATGIGYEIKYRKKDQVVWTFVGDGGTSEGDFHEGVNFAGAWNVPVVFVVQNNQYGISTPFKIQTASDGIAIKSYAYGVQGIQVDGNDVFAMTAALRKAAEHARSGNGPVLVEAITYRKGAHTTSDDPTKYRTKEEENEWEKTDPLKRLKLYMEDNNIDLGDEEQLVKEFKAEITRQFEAAENYGPYPLEDVFKYTYAEMPADLLAQQKEHENFLKWKEARS